MKNYTGTQKTQSGIPVRNVKWSPSGGVYIGQVWDEKSARPEKWTSCIWSATGKNRIRPEFNL